MAITRTSSGHYDMQSVITNGTPRFQSVTPVELLKKSKSQSEDWDFDVYQDYMLSPKGSKTPVLGVFKTESDQYLGDYQTNCLITNREVDEAVVNTIDKLGLEYHRSSRVFDHGAKTILNYDILSGMKNDSEEFNPVFSIKNSYNGTWSVTGSFAIKRLICLNGMEVSTSQASDKRKHSRSLLGNDDRMDLSFLAETFKIGLDNAQSDLRNFDKMKEIKIGNDDAFNILGNVVRCSRKAVSTTTAARIACNWMEPSKDEKPLGDTMYRLFNAGTRLFRDWENIKADASLKARRKFCDILNLASNPTDKNPYSQGALDELKAKPNSEFALVL